MEVFCLTELGKRGGRHFCKIEDKGRYGAFNYVVMTMVGKSLQDLRYSKDIIFYAFQNNLHILEKKVPVVTCLWAQQLVPESRRWRHWRTCTASAIFIGE